jgi:hypothetical protein
VDIYEPGRENECIKLRKKENDGNHVFVSHGGEEPTACIDTCSPLTNIISNTKTQTSTCRKPLEEKKYI